MIGDAPRSVITGVPGWETEAEQRYLYTLAQGVYEDGFILEIGAEYGMSASLFCKGAHESVKIWSVDLFPGDLLSKHRQNLKLAGFADRSKQLSGDSVETEAIWSTGPTRPIDLLFIDGDHSYEGCKRDIQAWVKHVAIDGVVAFHDCACQTNLNPHPLHFEVTRAVSEWFAGTAGDWMQIGMADSIMAFKRLA